MRTQPHLAVGAEHGPGEGLQRALEVGQGDVLVDHQPLHLVEHGGVGGIGVAPVRLARSDDVDGRPLLLHGAHLHGRGMRAQQDAVAHEEGVVQRAGGMIGRRVEGLEVVVLGLDLGPVDDLVAHADEDVLDLALGLSHQMQMPERRPPSREGDVDLVFAQAVDQLLSLELLAPGFHGVLRALRIEVAHLAHFWTFLRRQFGDGAQQQNQLGLAAQEAHPRVLERREIGGGGDRCDSHSV